MGLRGRGGSDSDWPDALSFSLSISISSSLGKSVGRPRIPRSSSMRTSSIVGVDSAAAGSEDSEDMIVSGA